MNIGKYLNAHPNLHFFVALVVTVALPLIYAATYIAILFLHFWKEFTEVNADTWKSLKRDPQDFIDIVKDCWKRADFFGMKRNNKNNTDII